MQPKKQLILLVLNELNINSDKEHPLTQIQIAENLSGEQFTCDRKTVCRNIKFLKDIKGFRLNPLSEASQLFKTVE